MTALASLAGWYGSALSGDEQRVRERTMDTLRMVEDHKGFAIGCGDSIADYVLVECFLSMVEAVWEYRKD